MPCAGLGIFEGTAANMPTVPLIAINTLVIVYELILG